MLYQRQLIDLLDRKFELVNSFSSRDFLLELENFMNFIKKNEMLKGFTNRLYERLKSEEQGHNQKREQLIEKLVQIRDELIQNFPDLDDSDMETPPPNDYYFFPAEYENSFANFDRIVAETKENFKTKKDIKNHDTTIRTLRDIIRSKLDYDFLGKEVFEKFINPLTVIVREDTNLWEKFEIYMLGSAEHAFRELDTSVGNIRNILLQGVPNQTVDSSKVQLRRVYEDIRAEIGSNLIHHEILNRYKNRCEYYDRDRLYQLAYGTKQQEDVLTKDLALYLFDNGISTLYRVRRDKHEYDLIGYKTDMPIFIEAKAYTDNKARQILIDGVSQIHAYLNALQAESSIPEAYYIVYRLGGPLYDLPPKISYNRYTVYPIVIDIGISEDSGRKQKKTISISLDKFFDVIKKEQEYLVQNIPISKAKNSYQFVWVSKRKEKKLARISMILYSKLSRTRKLFQK